MSLSDKIGTGLVFLFIDGRCHPSDVISGSASSMTADLYRNLDDYRTGTVMEWGQSISPLPDSLGCSAPRHPDSSADAARIYLASCRDH